jgi:hypothetical protein
LQTVRTIICVCAVLVAAAVAGPAAGAATHRTVPYEQRAATDAARSADAPLARDPYFNPPR